MGFEPDFLYPLENVTIAQGRDAMFTCVVNNLGGYRVSGEGAAARVRAASLSLSLPLYFHLPPLLLLLFTVPYSHFCSFFFHLVCSLADIAT